LTRAFGDRNSSRRTHRADTVVIVGFSGG
jgi:hypothetical protein